MNFYSLTFITDKKKAYYFILKDKFEVLRLVIDI